MQDGRIAKPAEPVCERSDFADDEERRRFDGVVANRLGEASEVREHDALAGQGDIFDESSSSDTG